MLPIRDFPHELRRRIRFVLTDIDDTLTNDGLLPAVAFAAMERLRDAGICVIPITGRPAGWCDHLARMWPVSAVVGENGAFYYRYDRPARRMRRRYFKPEAERAADRRRLEELKIRILSAVPGCAVSADQAFREADLAIDFCEDVPRLPAEAVARIVECFEAAGARAKVSSIHVNGWFGDYDKLTMTRRLFDDFWLADLDALRGEWRVCRRFPERPAHVRVLPALGRGGQRVGLHRADDPPARVRNGRGGRARVCRTRESAAEVSCRASPGDVHMACDSEDLSHRIAVDLPAPVR